LPDVAQEFVEALKGVAHRIADVIVLRVSQARQQFTIVSCAKAGPEGSLPKHQNPQDEQSICYAEEDEIADPSIRGIHWCDRVAAACRERTPG